MSKTYNNIGYALFGPPIFGFIDYIYKNTSDADNIFFLSRDATLLLPMVEKYFLSKGRSIINLKHLYVNRLLLKESLENKVPKNDLPRRYLKKNLKTQNNILIDIGYNGTISQYVSLILKEKPAWIPTKTLLFIYNGPGKSHKKIYPSSRIFGYLNRKNLSSLEYSKLKRNIAFLEVILGDTSRGSLIGYRKDLNPIFKKSEITARQLRASAHVYEGIEKYVNKYKKGRVSKIPKKDISCKLINDIAYPSRKLVKSFSHFKFTDSPGGKDQTLKMFQNTELGKTNSAKPLPFDIWHRNPWIGGFFAKKGYSAKKVDDFYNKLANKQVSVVTGLRGKSNLGDVYRMCL